MMDKPSRKGSLFTHLAIAICVAVIAVFSLSSVLVYLDQRRETVSYMEEKVLESTERLTETIAPYMESYAPNEYSNLVHAEARLHDLFAVLVYDRSMANITGQSEYVSGFIRNEQGDLVTYNDSAPFHSQQLQSTMFSRTSPVLSEEGEVLGNIVIHMSDEQLRKNLTLQLRQTVASSIVAATVLISLLLYFTNRFFVKPLEDISEAISTRDMSGIPVSHIPDFTNKELSSLSATMNNMIALIRHSHDSLSMEHSRLQNVIEGTRTGTWEWDVVSGFITYNGAWADILGWDLDALNGPPNQDWKHFIHPEDKPLSERQLAKLFAREADYYDCEIRLRHWSGQWINVLARGKIVEWDEQGRPLKVLGTHQDITAHKKAEENLQLAAKVFTHAREGIIIADSQTRIIEVNQAFCRITGYTLDEVKGKNPSVLQSGRQDEKFYKNMWHSLEKKGHWSGEIWNRRKDGEMYPELLTISAVTDEQGNPANYVAVFSDITAYKEHEHKLEKIAHFDQLTELPNRLLLGDRLKHAMKQAKRHRQFIAVIFLDLDGFKPVNDTYGHEVGDVLLQQLALRMKNALRDSDTIARIGGDEFVAVLTDLHSPESCQPLLPRLLAATSEPIDVNGHLVQVSASFGITTYPQSEEVNSDKLLRQADYAMYQAKLKGKRRYHFFDAELERSLKTQHEKLSELGKALENNQLFLRYQPKVNLREGDIIGLEALIRWQHPQKGELSPAEFIPLIENHSLIIDVGNWVIDKALSELVRWQEQGLNTTVSVNLAPHHLLQPDFIHKLRIQLARYPQINAEQLELEILETSAFEDFDAVSEVICQCRALGVAFAIDDFGTGYASLTYLKQLPAQTLKIDRSFIRDMLVDPDDLAILEGVISLANTFNREVLAEGVETKEQAQMLIWLGCELGQGFGISKPLMGEEVVEWSASWQPDPSWSEAPKLDDKLRPLMESVAQNRSRIERLRGYLNHSDS
ncbi:EAL domain-containing protein [Grimontia sp. S25]|uniref:EAL domain-containing protein n=1 Tax=Grimontia sedimenti TaxID=2711294 RepID=A0A6M1RHJ2_9GAMM|nr:GGDEF domain-containing phosphodiesterase [Grimontia sedimenti]NGN99614.1 EAL domain-containing protein [Grimontia sedimenti]